MEMIEVMERFCEWELDDRLVAQVRDWIASDIDRTSNAGRFCNRLQFGTAGLRAAMGAGFDRMNTTTVMQATQGVLRHYESELGAEAMRERGVAIAYDARHNSELFAVVTAAVFIGQGVRVLFHDRPVPTPILAYTAKSRRPACAIMITASHNPKNDNGYKLYGDDGCQIIPPHDEKIQALILQNLEPWKDYKGFSHEKIVREPLCQRVTEEIIAEYRKEVVEKLQLGSRLENRSSPPVVYSAFHGVGAECVRKVFMDFDLPPYIPVDEQINPDPEFPTLDFPNPEEGAGAMSCSIATAAKSGSTVILANDPDADRLAIAEKQEDGEWRLFTGNETAVLLADHMWKYFKPAAEEEGRKFCMISSAVSSKFLGAMGNIENFKFREALTGFKWLSHSALSLQQDGYEPLVTFEEAIGFMLRDVVYDKDGISAAAVFGEIAASLHKAGTTFSKTLNSCYQKYGYHFGHNGYKVCKDPAEMARIFEKLRGISPPYQVDGARLLSVRDVCQGSDSALEDGKSELPAVGGTEFITLRFATSEASTEADLIVSFRASGTEPKFKYYSELRCSAEEVANNDPQEKLASVVASLNNYILN